MTKAPLTEAIGASNSGGHFGPELKYADYDGIIFEGKSEKPVYLFINDDTVELRDTTHLWGKTYLKPRICFLKKQEKMQGLPA